MTAAAFLKYFAVSRVNYRTNATYLTNLIARGLTVALRIWVFTQLYRVTYQMTGSYEINGLTVPMVIFALMFTQSFQVASGHPRIFTLIDEEVKSGALAYSINKPYSYILFHYFGFLGRILSGLMFNLIVGFIAAFLLVGPLVFSWQGILSGVVLLFLGYILDFCISFCIGLSAFFLEDTVAFGWLYSKAQLALGGVILPLALFPDSIRSFTEFLPFGQLYYSAARIFVQFDFALFEKFILAQTFWIIIFGILMYVLFKKGIKYAAQNGG